MQDHRQQALATWLSQQFPQAETPIMISGDASFRRYFRFQNEGTSYIAVDAPPEKEASTAFVTITNLLQRHGIKTPSIITQDLAAGFLVLSDLGDTLLYQTLSAEEKEPYADVLRELKLLQAISTNDELPPYSEALLQQEMHLLEAWFFNQHLGLELDTTETSTLKAALDLLCESALKQAPVFVHRDFHSRNIMRQNSELFLIDYQDAVVGPYTYDLVSLLKDCYLRWPAEQVESWALAFWQEQRVKLSSLPDSEQDFLRDFHLMGLQRHLKVLGIFCRLAIRDNKHQYLDDLPRVLGYVLEVTARYPELAALHSLFTEKVVPRIDPDYQEKRAIA